jgi:hypothetical protein
MENTINPIEVGARINWLRNKSHANATEATEAARVKTMRRAGINLDPVTLPTVPADVLAAVRAKYGVA